MTCVMKKQFTRQLVGKIREGNPMHKFLNDESGQDLMEYGLLAAFLSIVTIAVLLNFGPFINGAYAAVENAIPSS